MGMRSGNYQADPTQLPGYSQVMASPELFMSTLENLHFAMGNKFKIPIIGGKHPDLHKLFIEVTSRGGIEKVIREKKWPQVVATFNFTSTTTNATTRLRDFYTSLLQQYEQIYFFRAPAVPAGNLQSPRPPRGRAQTPRQQPRISPAEMSRASSSRNSAGTTVLGVIDGKIDVGYLVTVMLGFEQLKGVIYQIPQDLPQEMPQYQSAGYKINDSEAPGRAVYQEKAKEDKDRYNKETKIYWEKLRMARITSDAVPLKQQLPGLDVDIVEVDTDTDNVEGDSPFNESTFQKSNSEDFKETEASLVSGAAGESSKENLDTKGPVGSKSPAKNTGDKAEKREGRKVDAGTEAAKADGSEQVS